tara:strand:+ start:380 stop:598 length:219 start_codon:yes stop_codon:yes gene_type:complete
MEQVLYLIVGISIIVVIPFIVGYIATGIKTRVWLPAALIEWLFRWWIGAVLCAVFFACSKIGEGIVTGIMPR